MSESLRWSDAPLERLAVRPCSTVICSLLPHTLAALGVPFRSLGCGQPNVERSLLFGQRSDLRLPTCRVFPSPVGLVLRSSGIPQISLDRRPTGRSSSRVSLTRGKHPLVGLLHPKVPYPLLGVGTIPSDAVKLIA